MEAREDIKEKGIEDIIRERARYVDFEMKKILLEENPFLLPDRWYKDDPIVHSLWSGGKRIRPALCLFSCETLDHDWKKALPTAAGIEFLHTFTLVHDDIMDGSELRRGKPSLHSIWGEPIAITAGDTLYSLAFKAFLKNSEIEGVTHEHVNRIIDCAVKKCISLARGQTLDIMFERTNNISVSDYIEMARLKTSSLIELSLMAGAIIGNGEKTEIDSMERLGRYIGLAFQIQDDVLDIEGIDTGKPRALDLERRKKTLIIIHALENSKGRDKKVLIDFLDGKDIEIEKIIDIIERTDSINFAKEKIEEFLNKARNELNNFGKNDGREHLEKTIDFLMKRRK